MRPELQAGETLAGYRIERLLGRGGMGAVYLAHDERLGRRIALKVLPPELAEDERFRDRFLREWRIAASLEHPHIIPVHDAGESDQRLYIAMRYVEGSDLRRLIETESPLEPTRALRLVSQVADALDAAHARGLVHRDVKPANVLLDRSGNSYLCDFGLTKDVSSVSGVTGTGQLVGTLEYMSPELIRAEPIDGRADEYALACVLYECLIGEPPFLRDQEAQLLWAHMNQPPPRPSERRPDLPEPLDGVLAAAMAKNADARYPTCGEFVAAALAALSGLEPSVPRGAQAEPVLRTFLIADMRGYTRFTNEHGDEAAARVAGAFAGLVEGVVRAHGGTLQELRGDEALCVFDSARSALRCAVDLHRRAAAEKLELPVGIGLDAGEAVPVAGGYRGASLNLASRLCSLAGPGDVLASEGIVHLAGPVEGVSYGGRRVERVKGVDRPVRAVEILSPGQAPRQGVRRRLRRATVPLRGRRLLVLGLLGAMAAAGVAVGLVVALSGGTPKGLAGIAPRSVGRIDPGRNLLVEELPVGGMPDAVAVGADAVWTANEVGQTISRIDLATHRPETVVAGAHPATIAVGGSAVWAGSRLEGTLLRLDPSLLRVTRTIRVADRGGVIDPPPYLTLGAGSVWIVSGGTTVTRISTATNRKTAEVGPDLGATCIAYGFEGAWVGGANSVSRVDPDTNELSATGQLPGTAEAVAVGEGAVWAVTQSPSKIVRLDPETTTIESTFDVDEGASAIAVGFGALWVTNAGDRTVLRIDPSTGAIVKRIVIGARPTGIAVGEGSVWISAA